jgi:protein TonB
VDVLVIGAEEADALLEGAKPQPPLPMPVSVTAQEPEPVRPTKSEPVTIIEPAEQVLNWPMPDLPSALIIPLPDRAAVPEASLPQPELPAPTTITNPPAAPKPASPHLQQTRRETAAPIAQRQPIASRRTQPEARGRRGEGEASQNSSVQRRGGSGGTATTAGSAAMTSYRSRLVAHLTRYKSYPEQAQERGIAGRNAVTLTLSREGRVLSAGLSSASGHSLLDSATLAAVRRAQPFPAIPDGGPPTLTVTIGVNYDLR